MKFIDEHLEEAMIVLLLAASSVAKSVVAFASGGPGYGLRVAAGLAAMVTATAAVAWFG